MMRLLAVLVCLIGVLAAPGARAQEPLITVTAEQDEVIVGQPYILRIEVLVPTFMPKAPVFPTFEAPGLIVRLPERSTSPISTRIEGQTWAGVQRTYRIYPMRAGVTDIPPQQLSIVYKDVETNADVPLSVEVPATQIIATVPTGARTLDPLIVARGLSIGQDWQVADTGLSVGDAVVRHVEIAITGASALFVPPLLDGAAPQTPDQDPVDGEPAAAEFLPYPEDPRVTETMDRGVMSGTRTEMVSYIAQSGGTATFPPITLSWYNLDTDEVEEIVLDGRTVTVAMPPRVRTAADLQKARHWALMLFLMLVVALAAHRWLWPVVRPALDRIRATFDGSAFAAQLLAERSAAAGDLGGLVQALALRATRGRPPSRRLRDALEALTRAVYRNGKTAAETSREWRDVRLRLRQDRPGLRDAVRDGHATGLPPLNPFS